MKAAEILIQYFSDGMLFAHHLPIYASMTLLLVFHEEKTFSSFECENRQKNSAFLKFNCKIDAFTSNNSQILTVS